MGDASTHAIFYQGYWHLVFEEDGDWVDVKNDYQKVCSITEAESEMKLKR